MTRMQYAALHLNREHKRFCEITGCRPEEIVIAGGAIASLLLGEKPKDYDFYFLRPQHHWNIIKRLIPDGIDYSVNNTSGIDLKLDWAFRRIDAEDVLPERFCDMGIRPTFITENAITFDCGWQVVTKFGSLTTHEIVNNFDFAHTQMLWDGRQIDGYTTPAFRSLATRDLHYQGSKYPLASLFRSKKFQNRGWNLPVGEMLKIVMDIQQFDLSDPMVLKEQLVGIDVAYLSALLCMLRERNDPVDVAWLTEVLDKLSESVPYQETED